MKVEGIGQLRLSLLGLIACIYLIPPPAVFARELDCADRRCGLEGDGTYPHLVLGTIQTIGSGQSSEAVFHASRARGWWKALPNDAAGFAKAVRPVAIQVQTRKGAVTMTMLMGDDEFQSAPLNVGDFVRYSPHDAAHPAPKEDTPAAWAYWKLIGCIQVICRQGDSPCLNHYHSGIFDHESGAELDARTRKPVHGGLTIDPVSYLTKTGSPDKPPRELGHSSPHS
jgi:hypothetical protein